MADERQLSEDILKEQFVQAWLRTGDPFKAGHDVFPTDPGRAMRASWEWPKDLEVLEYKAALILNTDGAAGTPTAEEFALEVYRTGAAQSYWEAKLGFFTLFAKLQGLIDKPASLKIDNRSVTINNKVMVVKDHGSDDAWERTLRENQKRLQSA